MDDLKGWLAQQRERVDAALERLLPPESADPATLNKAMRYSVFAGGKRLRPILAVAAAQACGLDDAAALDAGCAIEMIHTYSLIHDDLPAMDDDDLRRGKPTSHKVFGEGMAILAGDALLTLAFETLAAHPTRGAQLVTAVAQASGGEGMVGGQVADLENEGGQATEPLVESIHRRKTAALIRAAVLVGAIAAGAGDQQLACLTAYGDHCGLAFQVADDLLDITADAATLGKTPGKDAAQGKLTYPAAIGVEASRAKAAALAQAGIGAIGGLPAPERLTQIATHLVERAN